MKLAMWSGPRNLSTAMMYRFGNRADFAAWDEPFYAAYLSETGADHPMRDEIIAAHETNPSRVRSLIKGAVPNGKSHWYMKHMPHHMVGEFPLDWAQDCVNVHLIRHPARVIASYGNKRGTITEDDIGFQQQLKIYEQIGGIVIDSADIRANPEIMLRKLCDAINLPLDEAMLHWNAGPRPYDGVWASHWYDAVHRSTGFASAEGPLPDTKAEHLPLLESALPAYETLAAVKL